MVTSQNNLVCMCCRLPKRELHAKKSALISSMMLNLCNECIANKREPRFIIILYGRQHGIETVAEYLDNDRYVGDPILAKELS